MENEYIPSSSSGKVHTNTVFIDTGTPLPERYNETKIVILPRDPQWLFTYWDIADEKKEEVKTQIGVSVFDSADFILRIYHSSDPSHHSTYHTFDIIVHPDIRNWYVHIENAATPTVYIEMGMKTKDGKFIFIARSNTISLPSCMIASDNDAWWLSLKGYSIEEMLRLSSCGPDPISSLDIYKALLYRLQLQALLNISSKGIVREETPCAVMTANKTILKNK